MLLFCIYLLLSTILFLTRGGIILGLFCFYFTDVFFFKSVVLLFTIDSELWHLISKVSFIQYVRRIFRKTNISYPLIRTRTCAYQGVRNVSFLESFAYVLNEWSLNHFGTPLYFTLHFQLKHPVFNERKVALRAYSQKYIVNEHV